MILAWRLPIGQFRPASSESAGEGSAIRSWSELSAINFQYLDFSRRGDHHLHRPGGQHKRSELVPIRSGVRRLPGSGSSTELVRRQGVDGPDLQEGRRLSTQASGGWGDVGDPARLDRGHAIGRLGAVLAAAPAISRRHRRHGQQDRQDRLGGDGARRELQADGDGLNEIAATLRSAAPNWKGAHGLMMIR